MSKSRKRRARRNRKRRDPNADLFESDDEEDRRKVVLTPDSNWKELQFQAYLRMRMRQGMSRKNYQLTDTSGRTVSLAERIVRFRLLDAQGNDNQMEPTPSPVKAEEAVKLQDLLRQYIRQRQSEEARSSELLTEINAVKTSLQDDELTSSKGRVSQCISLGDSATDFNSKIRNHGVRYVHEEHDGRDGIGTLGKDAKVSLANIGSEGGQYDVQQSIHEARREIPDGECTIQTQAEIHHISMAENQNNGQNLDPNCDDQPGKLANMNVNNCHSNHARTRQDVEEQETKRKNQNVNVEEKCSLEGPVVGIDDNEEDRHTKTQEGGRQSDNDPTIAPSDKVVVSPNNDKDKEIVGFRHNDGSSQNTVLNGGSEKSALSETLLSNDIITTPDISDNSVQRHNDIMIDRVDSRSTCGNVLKVENMNSIETSGGRCAFTKREKPESKIDEGTYNLSQRSEENSSEPLSSGYQKKEEGGEPQGSINDVMLPENPTIAKSCHSVVNDSNLSLNAKPLLIENTHKESENRSKTFIISSNKRDSYVEETENSEGDISLHSPKSDSKLRNDQEVPCHCDDQTSQISENNIISRPEIDLPNVYKSEPREAKRCAHDMVTNSLRRRLLDSLESKATQEQDTTLAYLPSPEQKEIRKRREIYLQQARNKTGCDEFEDFFLLDHEVKSTPYPCVRQNNSHQDVLSNSITSTRVISDDGYRDGFQNVSCLSCFKNSSCFHLPLIETNKHNCRKVVSSKIDTFSLPRIHSSDIVSKRINNRVREGNKLREAVNPMPLLLDGENRFRCMCNKMAYSNHFSRHRPAIHVAPLDSESSAQRERRISNLYRKLKEFDLLQGHHSLAADENISCCCCYMNMRLEWGFLAMPNNTTKTKYGSKGICSPFRINSSTHSPNGLPVYRTESRQVSPGNKNDFIYLRDVSFCRFVHKSVTKNRVSAYLKNPVVDKSSHSEGRIDKSKSSGMKRRLNERNVGSHRRSQETMETSVCPQLKTQRRRQYHRQPD